MFQAPGREHYVYKVWAKDSGYLYAVDIFKKHQNNPHIPKIIRGPIALDENRTFWVIALEPLKEITDTDPRRFVCYVEGMLEQRRYLSTADLIQEFSYFYKTFQFHDSLEYYSDILETFWPTAKMFNEIGENFLDLGVDNVMRRPSDNALVITDPVAGF